MTQAFQPRGLLVAGSVALLACLLSSCSGRSGLYPVRGQVFYADKPAAGAIVVFHPVKSAAGAARPSGTVGPDGSFMLSTYTKNDGAPPGDYLVAIAWTGDPSQADPATGELRNKLPERYADPKVSGLKATVKEGANDLQPFKLTK